MRAQVRHARPARHHVAHQVGAERSGAGDDRRPRHRWVGAEHALHLGRFDPVAADLHLIVRPAEEQQVTARQHADQVAGAEHARPGRTPRVGDEPLRGRPGAAQVAARHPGAADVQLALGGRGALLVQHP